MPKLSPKEITQALRDYKYIVQVQQRKELEQGLRLLEAKLKERL